MPISRVRSVTDTSMMFITPMPPTSSEIAATAPSSVVNTSVLASDASRTEPWLRTWKPGLVGSVDVLALEEDRGHLGLGGVERAAADVAWTVIELSRAEPVRASWTAVIGASTTSSWSWTPLEPLGAVTPMTWKRVPLTRTAGRPGRRREEAARDGRPEHGDAPCCLTSPSVNIAPLAIA